MKRTSFSVGIIALVSVGMLFSMSFYKAPAAFKAGNAEKGKMLYTTCMACHGEQGEGKKELNAPRLVGQSEWYLFSQLKKFKDGIRGGDPKDETGAQMRPMAMTLTEDAAIHDVITYIKTLNAPMPTATIEGDVEKGKALYATCLACHGEKGKGSQELKSPALTGLNDWYMYAQLKKFKEGIRGSDPKDETGVQMRPMAMTLADDAAMKNVIAYIQTFNKIEDSAKTE